MTEATIILLILFFMLLPFTPVYIAIFAEGGIVISRTTLHTALLGKFCSDGSFTVRFISYRVYRLVEEKIKNASSL